MTAQYLRTQAKRMAAALLADILGLDLGVA